MTEEEEDGRWVGNEPVEKGRQEKPSWRQQEEEAEVEAEMKNTTMKIERV